MTTVKRIRDTLAANEGITRSGLSRQVCEWLNWRTPRGTLREMNCRKALLKLERLGEIRLPASLGHPGARTAGPFAAGATRATVHVSGPLAALGRIELVPIEARTPETQQWRDMLDVHHPLTSGPLCGAQQRYLIRSEHCGWLGG